MRFSKENGLLLALSGLLLLTVPRTASAQIQINTPTTINYAITGNVSIGLGTSAPFIVSLVPGGTISGYLYGSGNSTVDILDGTVGTYLQADANSVFNIYGSGLTLTNPTPYFTGTQYNLAGVLQDGHTIYLSAYSYNNGQFLLHNNPSTVPEPDSMTLLGLGLGGVVLAARRRRKA